MKKLIIATLVTAATLLSGCVAYPTRHGLVVAPAVPVVGVGVGYGPVPYYGPRYYGPYR